jgi:hypothetical protein
MNTHKMNARVAEGMTPAWRNREDVRTLDGLRTLVEDCWRFTPESRPTMAQVLERLEEMGSHGSFEYA